MLDIHFTLFPAKYAAEHSMKNLNYRSHELAWYGMVNTLDFERCAATGNGTAEIAGSGAGNHTDG